MILLDKISDRHYYGFWQLVEVSDEGVCGVIYLPTSEIVFDKCEKFGVNTARHLDKSHSLVEFIEEYKKDLELLERFNFFREMQYEIQRREGV